MTMITPSYLGETIEYSSLHACRSTLEDPTRKQPRNTEQWVAFELFGNTYVIAGDYKAIRVRTGMYGDGKWHLYDIKNDPGETRPLDRDMPERLEQLVAIFDQYAKNKGLVPVAENWNPWHGFLDKDGKPVKDQEAAAESAKNAMESAQ